MSERREKFLNMDIIMTGFAGLAGSVILAEEKEKELRVRYSEAFLEEVKQQQKLLKQMPENTERDIALIYPLSKGGIFAGLWNMAEEARIGLEVDLKKIPIKQETIEICNFFDINPYQLLSEGSCLILSPNGGRLKHQLMKNGIWGDVIGYTMDNNDRVVINGEERRFLEKNYEEALDKLQGSSVL